METYAIAVSLFALLMFIACFLIWQEQADHHRWEVKRELALEGAAYVSARLFKAYSALQDIAAEHMKLTYADLEDVVRRNNTANAYTPLYHHTPPEEVPIEWREAVCAYNEFAAAHSPHLVPLTDSGNLTRVERMEAVVQNFPNQLTKYADKVALQTGLPYSEVFTIANVYGMLLKSMLQSKMSVDPETILPSIY